MGCEQRMVSVLGFRGSGLGVGIQDLRFKVWGLGFRVWGLQTSWPRRRLPNSPCLPFLSPKSSCHVLTHEKVASRRAVAGFRHRRRRAQSLPASIVLASASAQGDRANQSGKGLT